jgi:thermitase
MTKTQPGWHIRTMLGLACLLSLPGWLLPARGPALAAVDPATSMQPAACLQPVANGGFESGSTSWTQTSNHTADLISNFFPHRGGLGAYMGDANNADDRLSQVIAVPANVISPTLSFYWAMSTDEPSGSATHDTLDVALYNTGGTLLEDLTVPPLDNTATQYDWQQVTADLAAYRGQTVELRIQVTNDATYPTAFYVDDVSLLACSVYLPVVQRH